MNVGLVYSATTWRLRSVVIPENDSQLTGRAVGRGEALQIISSDTYAANPGDQLQVILNGLTGQVPSGDRYISVDSGNNVVSVHIADPAGCGDTAPQPGNSLIAHDTAVHGDLYWNGTAVHPVHAPRRVPYKLSAKGRKSRRSNLIPL